MGDAEEECNNRPVSAKPESAHIMPATPEFAHVMLAMPESAHVMPATKISPKEYFLGGYSTQAPADAKLGPGLIASVMDPPLMSVRAAGIPRASALAVTETVPLTSVLPVMRSPFCACGLHTALLRPPEVAASTAEPPEVAASTAEPPEVAASAAEPPNVVAPTHELTGMATKAVPEFTATEAPAPPWPPAPPVPPLLHAPGPVTLHGPGPPSLPSILPLLYHPPGPFGFCFRFCLSVRSRP